MNNQKTETPDAGQIELLESENAELLDMLKEAVRIGKMQADEYDRFWQAMDCGTAEITVDDAIAKYQTLAAEIARLTNELEAAKGLLDSAGLIRSNKRGEWSMEKHDGEWIAFGRIGSTTRHHSALAAFAAISTAEEKQI